MLSTFKGLSGEFATSVIIPVSPFNRNNSVSSSFSSDFTLERRQAVWGKGIHWLVPPYQRSLRHFQRDSNFPRRISPQLPEEHHTKNKDKWVLKWVQGNCEKQGHGAIWSGQTRGERRRKEKTADNTLKSKQLTGHFLLRISCMPADTQAHFL